MVVYFKRTLEPHLYIRTLNTYSYEENLYDKLAYVVRNQNATGVFHMDKSGSLEEFKVKVNIMTYRLRGIH